MKYSIISAKVMPFSCPWDTWESFMNRIFAFLWAEYLFMCSHSLGSHFHYGGAAPQSDLKRGGERREQPTMSFVATRYSLTQSGGVCVCVLRGGCIYIAFEFQWYSPLTECQTNIRNIHHPDWCSMGVNGNHSSSHIEPVSMHSNNACSWKFECKIGTFGDAAE